MTVDFMYLGVSWNWWNNHSEDRPKPQRFSHLALFRLKIDGSKAWKCPNSTSSLNPYTFWFQDLCLSSLSAPLLSSRYSVIHRTGDPFWFYCEFNGPLARRVLKNILFSTVGKNFTVKSNREETISYGP